MKYLAYPLEGDMSGLKKYFGGTPGIYRCIKSVTPKVLLPYKFSKLRPIKYRILAIYHQK
jgi:hypothetical protein